MQIHLVHMVIFGIHISYMNDQKKEQWKISFQWEYLTFFFGSRMQISTAANNSINILIHNLNDLAFGLNLADSNLAKELTTLNEIERKEKVLVIFICI